VKWGTGTELLHRRFRLDIRKNFFTKKKKGSPGTGAVCQGSGGVAILRGA